VTTRSQLAVEHVRCPTCDQAAGSPCVGARVPDHLRNQPSSRERVAREGQPLRGGGVHRERFDAYGTFERREAARAQLTAATAAATALDNPASIALAECEHDRREAAALVGWLRAGGAALLCSTDRNGDDRP
jgi:hypothetical protein